MVEGDEKYNDSYELLMGSTRVTDEVKNLLKEKLFLEQNPEIVLNLARLLFLVDEIGVDKNEIVARRRVSTIKEPNIPIDKIIYRYLVKIKHDTLSPNDVSKLNELQQYPSYLRLYNLLKRAIDQKVKIQKIDNLEKLKLSINTLEVFLKDG